MSDILEITKETRTSQGELSVIPKTSGHNLPLNVGGNNVISDSDIPEFISKVLFQKRGFIAREIWDTNLNIQGKVSEVNDEFVECLCLIDKENHYFEYRSFPKLLFENIENLKKKPYVILNIMSKANSIRIDVYDGEKRVEKDLFELKEDWENLDDTDLETPLDTFVDI